MTRLARLIERLHRSMTTHYNAHHRMPEHLKQAVTTKQEKP